MITGMDRRACEQRFHDEQAQERAASFRSGRANLRFADAAFLDHESWIRPSIEKLGPLAGKSALDYGCGHGMAAVVLTRAGARVTAFDLSPGYVQEAQLRAQANGVAVDCVVASGEELPFEDASFDVVWGNAVLHHVVLQDAARELHRVLKPGGRAVFCEPWGGNPLLAFARDWLPYPGKDRTADEAPLNRHDLQPLFELFPDTQVVGFQLLSMLRRIWPQALLCRSLEAIDSRLLRIFPGLNNWCRYAMISLRRAP